MRENLKSKLKDCGWDRILSEFIDSDEFPILMYGLTEKKEVLTPSIGQVFRVFYECPYSKLNTVIVGLGPYEEEGEADGLAFSCGNTMDIQPTLKAMFEEIQKTVYKPLGEDWYAWEADLTRWANQGVLLLNLAFTTDIGKSAAHYELWKPFLKYLFNKLAESNTGLVYIFMGDSAKTWAKLVPETNYKFYCYHPNSACYNGGDWESNDVFNRTNEILEGANGIKIIW
jgi:uracil-DNA glycosylase